MSEIIPRFQVGDFVRYYPLSSDLERFKHNLGIVYRVCASMRRTRYLIKWFHILEVDFFGQFKDDYCYWVEDVLVRYEREK